MPVRFLFDEFSNVSLPNGYERLQSTMRSRNIMSTIILQNISQLKALFKDSWGGHHRQRRRSYLPGRQRKESHKYISELLGKQSLTYQTTSASPGRNGSTSTSTQLMGRELMTPEEVRMLDNRDAIVLIRGEAPVIDSKYDLMKHPNIKETEDGGAALIHSPVCLYDIGDLSFLSISGRH